MDKTKLPTADLEAPLPFPSSSSSNVKLQVPNYVFGPVPSQSEVQFAISVLENFVHGMSPNQSKPQWVVQLLSSPTSKLLISYGLKRLLDAFQLWQVDPFVKRLVISVVTDKVFWDAIMNNKLVRELGKKPLYLDESTRKECKDGNQNFGCKDPALVATILQWIWEITKEKLAEVVESFKRMMNKFFGDGEMEKLSPVNGDDEQLKEKVQSSFLLSVVITLIVIVIRAI